MLNYDLLYSDFQKILNSYDEQSLENWLIFDENRLNNIVTGSSIVKNISTIEIEKTEIKTSAYSDVYNKNEQIYKNAA